MKKTRGQPARRTADPTRRFAAALWALPVVLTGCATVWTRGVVQDAHGASVSGVSVRVLDNRGANPISATLTDSNGCFVVGPFAARGGRGFELEILAPGYNRATFTFDLETPVLLVTLFPASSEGPSEIRPATYSERARSWEPFCVPSYPPGAEQLSP